MKFIEDISHKFMKNYSPESINLVEKLASLPIALGNYTTQTKSKELIKNYFHRIFVKFKTHYDNNIKPAPLYNPRKFKKINEIKIK